LGVMPIKYHSKNIRDDEHGKQYANRCLGIAVDGGHQRNDEHTRSRNPGLRKTDQAGGQRGQGDEFRVYTKYTPLFMAWDS